MADVNLKNLARMTVTSSGTGTITLNTAVTGFLTFDLAGCSTAAAGSVVRYAISDTTKSEFAYGTYTSSSLTLTRGSSTTGMKSTNADSPIDMSTAAQVFITDSYADHPFVVDTSGSPITYTLSQNAATNAVVSNTNAGATAAAGYWATSDAGSVKIGANGSGAGSVGAIQWTGSGSFIIDAVNATGNISIRTGAAPTSGLTISSTQAVAIPGTLALTGALTYGGVALNAAVTGTGNMVLSASPIFTGVITAAAVSMSGGLGAASVTATGLVSGATAGGAMVATQAQMETATSTNTVASPGTVVYNPGVAKAWVSFNAAGAISSQFNVTSITVNGVGDFTVNFTVAMSGAAYAVVTCVDDDDRGMTAQPNTKAAGSVRLLTIDSAGNVTDPSGEVYAVVFGDR